MAIHSSILSWRIPIDRGAWWATVHEVAESDTIDQLSTEQHRIYTLVYLFMSMDFPVSSVIKNQPASTGDEDSIPGQGDPLEEEMAVHSSILAWRIPWTEEPG